ncbi:MAG: serine/threonine protein kinase [Polyangiaceae bacterium]|jgi:serine/threonine-protein kinase|nr:serine/threonine protein kinase [Polyangiaceae bacterium]
MLDSGVEAFQNGVSVNQATEIETDAAASLVGTVLAGRYRIERLLGSGGMGSVYRAEHVLMRKACAVKVLHREMTQVKEVVARFEREAVAAARIEHPHVATATDFGQLENGSFYLVLEFIEGRSLGQLIGELGSLPEERALVVARQIADALAAAHSSGIVHRDLKPDNVMLVAKDDGSDFVKVLDFGIAKVQIEGTTADQPALTRLNTVMGTPEYMAPEQARGEAVDTRADLYTLGIILYEMLAGTSPFRHEEFVVVLTKKLTEDAPPLPAHVSQATRDLVFKLLQRTPSDRPQSAAELVSRIDGILGFSPAPSLAFAPVSAQVRKPQPTSPDVAHANTVVGEAYANTVVGEAPVAALRPTLVSRIRVASAAAKTALAPAVQLAKRRVPLGSKQVPLGAIGGALVGLPIVIALGLASVSGGAAPSAAKAGSIAVVVDDDISELMKRAEGGDRTALAELSGRAAEAKQAGVYQALGRGYFKIGQIDAGLRAYRAGGKLDPKLGEASEVMADVRRGLADVPNQPLSLEVAATLGAPGADLLYEVYDSNRTANAALSKQAKALLDSEPVVAAQSPALKLVLELPKAKTDGCAAVKKLLPRIQQSGDARLVPTLTRMNDRRGCGFLGLRDCFACLRTKKGDDLAAALKAAGERPAPKLGS